MERWLNSAGRKLTYDSDPKFYKDHYDREFQSLTKKRDGNKMIFESKKSPWISTDFSATDSTLQLPNHEKQSDKKGIFLSARAESSLHKMHELLSKNDKKQIMQSMDVKTKNMKNSNHLFIQSQDLPIQSLNLVSQTAITQENSSKQTLPGHLSSNAQIVQEQKIDDMGSDDIVNVDEGQRDSDLKLEAKNISLQFATYHAPKTVKEQL